MILADKIIYLRKKQGLSQEELAERLGISRQAVSKWESAQAMPDISKIVELSKIFGVSTDALIKDEIDITEESEAAPQTKRHVSYAEAEEYLRLKFRAAYLVALATFIIILSPGIMLILMSLPSLPDPLAVGIGLSALFVMVAVAVCIYVYSYLSTSKYEFINSEEFTIDYGTTNMLNDIEKTTRAAYVMRNIAATATCILSVLPLILTALVPNVTTLAIVIALTATLAVIGVGVVMFITSGMKRSAVAALKETKKAQKVYSEKLEEAVNGAMWTLTVAIYLLYSFKSGNWHFSWLIFLFAATVSAMISAVFVLVRKANGNDTKGDGE